MTPKNDIQILRINYLHGSNIWTYREVLEVWLDLGELEQFPSHTLPGLNQRLETWMPALVEHTCTPGVRGGFLQRLAGGTWMGHVLEHVIIELLNLAGMQVTFGQTRETTTSGTYKMVFGAPDEAVARLALAEGHAVLMAAINDLPADIPAAVDRLRAQIDKTWLGPGTQCIVQAAHARRIPHIRLSAGNLVQLGYGARQRRIWTAESDRTSAIGESIAADKDLTKTLLAACGVPVPEGRVVDGPDAAWEAAQDVGLPVVVKPSDGNHARGVTLDLRARDDIAAAFALAEGEGSDVIVERFVPGTEHRLLVVGGKVVAATRGEPVEVVGDGASTVARLVDQQMNSDPRRGWEHQYPLTTIDVARDGGVQLELRRQGLEPGSVPAAGRRVLIQRTGNMSIDCTDDVHPEVAHAATLAARIVGLDIAGIDLVAHDIRRPLQAQGGAIVEVNAGPGLLMHLTPTVGRPRPVGEAIRDHLFADGEDGRIPVVGIAGSRHSAAVARLVAWLTHLDGKVTGLACRDGSFVDRRRIDASDCAHWQAGERILLNRNVEAAIIENGPASILRSGLAYDRCRVGVVTDFDIGADLAHFDVRDEEQMRKVMRTQVDVVLSDGAAVLNGAVPAVAALASLCDGEVILYACDPDAPAVAAHRAASGRAVLLRDGRAALAADGHETLLPGLGDLDDWRARHGDVPDEALLAAVATGWALGIAPPLVGAGLEAFEQEPGVPLRAAATPAVPADAAEAAA